MYKVPFTRFYSFTLCFARCDCVPYKMLSLSLRENAKSMKRSILCVVSANIYKFKSTLFVYILSFERFKYQNVNTFSFSRYYLKWQDTHICTLYEGPKSNVNTVHMAFYYSSQNVSCMYACGNWLVLWLMFRNCWWNTNFHIHNEKLKKSLME